MTCIITKETNAERMSVLTLCKADNIGAYPISFLIQGYSGMIQVMLPPQTGYILSH
ncbi:hypothetical protein OO184_19270 [Photorhabdus sp. APURE]|uniref:hypothetical protein n=1 Tax=Photorhabdus aballayi TaxID=2991723 RepID=UPI00223E7CD7|nr:hypothetical protein [Photorhabdus aballayi]MCW7550012.1 hypothetical protein [Photorhabdus aballayi]